MLYRLKEVSKIFLALGIILYIFGFVSLNSFLASFGIVSFDVINSRFIAAGIFSFMAACLTFFIVINFYNKIAQPDFYSKEGVILRFTTYIIFFTTTYTTSFVLNLLFNLGSDSTSLSNAVPLFRPWFGDYDFLGGIISSIAMPFSEDYNFVLSLSIYIFIYASLLIMCFQLYYIISRNFLKKTQSVEKEHTIPTNNLNAVTLTVTPPLKTMRYFALCFIEVFACSFLVALAIYSFIKLRTNLFKFDSLLSSRNLSQSLLFSWVYLGVVTCLPFIHTDLFKQVFSTDKLNPNTRKSIVSFNLQILDAILFIVLPVIVALIIFGQVIFPRIPYAIGGGEPRKVEVGFKDRSPLDSTSTSTFFIGESSQYVFLVSNSTSTSKAFQISKEQIEFIQTMETHLNGSKDSK